jgi:hypothetical protein
MHLALVILVIRIERVSSFAFDLSAVLFDLSNRRPPKRSDWCGRACYRWPLRNRHYSSAGRSAQARLGASWPIERSPVNGADNAQDTQ